MKITKSYLKQIIKEELEYLGEETATDINKQIAFYKTKYSNVSEYDIKNYLLFLKRRESYGPNPSAEAKKELETTINTLNPAFQAELKPLTK